MRYFVVLRNSSKECHSEEVAIFRRSQKWVKNTVIVSSLRGQKTKLRGGKR